MVSCESCGVVLSKVGGGLIRRCMGYADGCCKEVTLCKRCRAEEPQREVRFREHIRTCKYRLARIAAIERGAGDELEDVEEDSDAVPSLVGMMALHRFNTTV